MTIVVNPTNGGVTARNIITLALESMNRLSPGEAINADLGAACLRRLNAIADAWSAGREMTPQDVITSGAVTGQSLALGVSPFAAIGAGEEIMQLQADGYPTEPITMQQYNNINDKAQTGRPQVWAWDGLATVYLYPAATGNMISALTRASFSQFIDMDTAYSMPAGYQGAFAAELAVAMAPALIGKVTADLVQAKREAMHNIAGGTVRPAILSNDPLASNVRGGGILRGWN